MTRRPGRASVGAPANVSDIPVEPMLATAAKAAPRGAGWIVEPKLDGYRIIAHVLRLPAVSTPDVRLFTRSGRNVTGEMQQIARALATLAGTLPAGATPLVLDGEAVVQEGAAVPRFQAMQRFRDTGQGRLRYYVFDLLTEGGTDLTASPLSQRRRRLTRLLSRGTRRRDSVVQIVPRLRGGPESAFRAAVAAGNEGVILKRSTSLYRPGQRSDEWLKLKRTHTEDLVVGGYSAGQGGRQGEIGSLLVGAPAPHGLVYAGHVGTGFSHDTLEDLKARLDPLRVSRSPFAERPPARHDVTWVRPEIVVEVKYTERTEDGVMRLPVFLRVRDDKRAAGVEVTAPVAPQPAQIIEPVNSSTGDAREMSAIRDVITQIEQLESEGELRVGRHRFRVTNLDKVLWPLTRTQRLRGEAGARAGLTKRDLLRYLALVSPALLRHLRDRPVTLTRYPHGAGRPGFYQRHWDGAAPPFAHSILAPDPDDPDLDAERSAGADERERGFIAIDSLAALLYGAQLGTLEFHPWYLRAGEHRPDFLVFDLDAYLYAGTEEPGEEPAPHAAGFDAVRQAAWWLKESLDRLSLPAFVKTSGRTGLHIFVPLRREPRRRQGQGRRSSHPDMSFDETHAAARTICEHLERRHPAELTTAWAIERRRGKVFLDYNQNRRSKTLAGAYSPRAALGAPVSLPVTWDELDSISPSEWTVRTVPARLALRGDPWDGMLDAAVDLARRLAA